MKTQIEATTGEIFLAVKGNRNLSIIKGKHYVYDCGEVKTYTRRNVTILANGDEILETEGLMERVENCPFCGAKMYARCGCGGLCDSKEPCPMEESAEPKLIHDGCECAHEWDAKTKGYCKDCNADLESDGSCPKCDGVAESANDRTELSARVTSAAHSNPKI